MKKIKVFARYPGIQDEELLDIEAIDVVSARQQVIQRLAKEDYHKGTVREYSRVGHTKILFYECIEEISKNEIILVAEKMREDQEKNRKIFLARSIQ